ncbi:MAG TPA: glycosyltransferase family 4 protein [Candidatus Saccharimonadales bacterium]|nr:glycosyltransferase family 4 protein [Candidatus Saccharimonadales bacterium]
MKIAFYMTTVLEYGGGLEKYLIETAANMSRLPGVQADVITMDNKHTDRIVKSLSLFYMKRIDPKLSYKEDIADIRQQLGNATYYKATSIADLRQRLQQYDVVYSKNELLEGFVFKVLVGYKSIPPVIFGGHTALHYPVATSLTAKLHNVLYAGWPYKFLAGGVSKFHALNGHDAALYKQLFPKREVARIYNPFDIAAFRQKATAHPYTLSTDTNHLYVMWIGRLTEQKGVADLVRLIPAVNARLEGTGTKVIWDIFGDGDLRSDVENLANHASNVRYFGHIDQASIASVYQKHQFLVSTSKWEGYPYTLIEPQAFGLQLFAYDIPGPADILEAYEGGHIATGFDALVDQLARALQRYDTPADIPPSQPSAQFEPRTIYQQLLSLLKTGETTHARTD